ncbi:unnamed protein product, partial [Brachionus calyciflorus]
METLNQNDDSDLKWIYELKMNSTDERIPNVPSSNTSK